jgi:uncharacterized C2H2 Zn-finger protein
MEFAHIGKSCAHCNSQDFLPFTCDCCNSVFCLEHRSYIAHNCSKASGKDHRVVTCPICTRSIHFYEGDGKTSVHEVFDKHLRLECTKSSDIKSSSTSSTTSSSTTTVKAAKRCCTKGCRETLTTSNTYYCPKCRQETCLKHRFTDAHECGSLSRGVGRSLGGGNNNPSILLSSSSTTSSSTTNTINSNSKATLSNDPPPSSVTSSSNQNAPFFASRSPQPQGRNFDMRAQLRETAHRRGATGGREGSYYNNSIVNGGGGGSGDRLEPCSHCGAIFDDPVALITHVSTAHTGESERCAACGQVFPDVSSLISHTDVAHSETRKGSGSCSVA